MDDSQQAAKNKGRSAAEKGASHARALSGGGFVPAPHVLSSQHAVRTHPSPEGGMYSNLYISEEGDIHARFSVCREASIDWDRGRVRACAARTQQPARCVHAMLCVMRLQALIVCLK